MPNDLIPLLSEIQTCTCCADHLPLGPRPVVRISQTARILIIGQAPGTKVHASGIPWDDASGKRLRQWMGVDDKTFYDASRIAIMPMGFCYPGKGKSGDLPPRAECAPQWHQPLKEQMPDIELTLLIGQYAQNYYLKDDVKTLTERVKNWRDFPPEYFALPHPSPRNQIWLKKNPWFEAEMIPHLQSRIKQLL
ncbi:MAG: IclR family transcriptional regulator [Oceanospirillaceae bacterium]|nr:MULTISPECIES: uracil-DNA glycosylase family protein [unclassified Thalassolituus]MAS25419.1 IclR family transcriptional regulator [Oceanospirillaceae bacterium]MAX97957.1 IclR family transcriptional regulator [Oceanospirillaceae bacterium]MBL33595.1 IclR family transcriptional regulator [Oceanospirillaceae bacterium]MBS53863.1 IclR family transcriptional regulator [Oceanospirillaceae bacterium]|tara:strand:+ start:274 stop:852 length:579 start_codon:yes stop_codon:yes gene_type:complete